MEDDIRPESGQQVNRIHEQIHNHQQEVYAQLLQQSFQIGASLSAIVADDLVLENQILTSGRDDVVRTLSTLAYPEHAILYNLYQHRLNDIKKVLPFFANSLNGSTLETLLFQKLRVQKYFESKSSSLIKSTVNLLLGWDYNDHAAYTPESFNEAITALKEIFNEEIDFFYETIVQYFQIQKNTTSLDDQTHLSLYEFSGEFVCWTLIQSDVELIDDYEDENAAVGEIILPEPTDPIQMVLMRPQRSDQNAHTARPIQISDNIFLRGPGNPQSDVCSSKQIISAQNAILIIDLSLPDILFDLFDEEISTDEDTQFSKSPLQKNILLHQYYDLLVRSNFLLSLDKLTTSLSEYFTKLFSSLFETNEKEQSTFKLLRKNITASMPPAIKNEFKKIRGKEGKLKFLLRVFSIAVARLLFDQIIEGTNESERYSLFNPLQTIEDETGQLFPAFEQKDHQMMSEFIAPIIEQFDIRTTLRALLITEEE